MSLHFEHVLPPVVDKISLTVATTGIVAYQQQIPLYASLVTCAVAVVVGLSTVWVRFAQEKRAQQAHILTMKLAALSAEKTNE